MVFHIASTIFTLLQSSSTHDNFVSIFEGSQWSGQVKESLELQLTYGTVMSALIFVIFIAGLRYVIPWPRISGLIEKGIKKIRNQSA